LTENGTRKWKALQRRHGHTVSANLVTDTNDEPVCMMAALDIRMKKAKNNLKKANSFETGSPEGRASWSSKQTPDDRNEERNW
jgi:hypothetical protein